MIIIVRVSAYLFWMNLIPRLWEQNFSTVMLWILFNADSVWKIIFSTKMVPILVIVTLDYLELFSNVLSAFSDFLRLMAKHDNYCQNFWGVCWMKTLLCKNTLSTKYGTTSWHFCPWNNNCCLFSLHFHWGLFWYQDWEKRSFPQ